MSLWESWQTSAAFPLKVYLRRERAREREGDRKLLLQIRTAHNGEVSDQMWASTCEAVDPLIKFLFVICLGQWWGPGASVITQGLFSNQTAVLKRLWMKCPDYILSGEGCTGGIHALLAHSGANSVNETERKDEKKKKKQTTTPFFTLIRAPSSSCLTVSSYHEQPQPHISILAGRSLHCCSYFPLQTGNPPFLAVPSISVNQKKHTGHFLTVKQEHTTDP